MYYMYSRSGGRGVTRARPDPMLYSIYKCAIYPMTSNMAGFELLSSIYNGSLTRKYEFTSRFTGHQDRVTAIAISPRGDLLASGGMYTTPTEKFIVTKNRIRLCSALGSVELKGAGSTIHPNEGEGSGVCIVLDPLGLATTWAMLRNCLRRLRHLGTN
jgi:WD40 repeat protein